ncbi:MAG: DUF4159 domain-containing protein [Pseudomonadota bacterium]
MSLISPLILTGLLALPLLVWLLRAIPPRPKREEFGGMFFLRKLSTQKSTPVRTPPLILLIRLLAFTALIIGLAGPRLGPEPQIASGPLTLLMDDGWDAAAAWPDRKDAARRLLAETDGAVTIVHGTSGEVIGPLAPLDAMAAIDRMQPRARLTDWRALADVPELTNAERLAYVAGGAAPTRGDAPDRNALSVLRRAEIVLPSTDVIALGAAGVRGDALSVPVVRGDDQGLATYTVSAVTADGRTMSSASVSIEPGSATADAVFRLPLPLRNQVARFDVDGLRSAGATELLSASARRTLVGLVASGSETLREGGFYIARALAPTTELLEGSILELIAEEPGLIVLDDVGTLRPDDREALVAFVSEGGILLRFAGPSLLNTDLSGSDSLLPAPLLGGERALGGALTWADPQRVATINTESPVGDLRLSEEISIRRQVLTVPGASAEVWMSLADGTPLVTARQEGQGLVVLIHVSAAPTWSDFPISGLFAQLLQRLAALAETDLSSTPPSADTPLPATKLLTGLGTLTEPGPEAPAYQDGETPAPGLYGEGASARAVNAYDGSAPLITLTPDLLPRGSRVLTFTDGPTQDFGPWLVTLALLFLAVDAVLTLMGGRIPAAALRASVILAAIVLTIPTAHAQLRPPLSQKATEAALHIRFAYVETGNTQLDRLSKAGLQGLSKQAAQRTALEPAAPQGIDPNRDELSVYTLVYWPLRPGQDPLSDSALQRLEDFMASGGMLIIDTADGARPGGQPSLQGTLARLNAPRLEPLQADNVLLFSFYRLDELHGRNSSGKVWVESNSALDQRKDGVPSLIIAGRDWSSAWALDDNGIPLRPAGPGGEARREYAFRSGINMAMVAITGNYKADQAEVQTMLDTLGEDDDAL